MAFKLYYSEKSCGIANYIIAKLSDLDFDSEIVNLITKKTESGKDFNEINDKGNVPAIVFSDGTILNENVATLTYLADQNPSKGFAPQSGIERYQYLNIMGYLNSELHPAFGALFTPGLEGSAKDAAIKKAISKAKRFSDYILKDQQFLSGNDKPNAADLYAAIILSWGTFFNIDHADNPKVADYFKRTFHYTPFKEIYDKVNA